MASTAAARIAPLVAKFSLTNPPPDLPKRRPGSRATRPSSRKTSCGTSAPPSAVQSSQGRYVACGGDQVISGKAVCKSIPSWVRRGVQRSQQEVQPRLTVGPCCDCSDDAEMPHAPTRIGRKLGHDRGHGRVGGDDAGTFESGQVPGLAGREDGDGDLGRSGNGEQRGERRTGQGQRCVDLVADDDDAVPVCQLDESGELLRCVYPADGIVGVAQHVSNCAGGEFAFDQVEVQGPAVLAAPKRRLDQPRATFGDPVEERRVNRRTDHHRSTTSCHDAEELADPHPYVGHGGDLSGIDLPGPPPSRESGQRLPEIGRRVGVPGVGPVHRVAQLIGDDRCQRIVHLRDGQRQDVVWVGAPLGATPLPQHRQRIDVELEQRVRVGHHVSQVAVITVTNAGRLDSLPR